MLKQGSIYLIKVCGCAPAAFRGEQLSKKDEKGRCYGGWLPLKMGSLGVDAYVYLVFNEDGSLSSDRSFADLLEKLPSKEAIGTKTVFEVNELLTASPLLNDLQQQWGLFFDKLTEVQENMESVVARALIRKGFYQRPTMLTPPLEIRGLDVVIRALQVDRYLNNYDKVLALTGDSEEWRPLSEILTTDQWCTLIYKLSKLWTTEEEKDLTTLFPH